MAPEPTLPGIFAAAVFPTTPSPEGVDSLRCPRCKQWADPDEWDIVDAKGGGQLV